MLALQVPTGRVAGTPPKSLRARPPKGKERADEAIAVTASKPPPTALTSTLSDCESTATDVCQLPRLR
jgi:hypothetical protein